MRSRAKRGRRSARELAKRYAGAAGHTEREYTRPLEDYDLERDGRQVRLCLRYGSANAAALACENLREVLPGVSAAAAGGFG